MCRRFRISAEIQFGSRLWKFLIYGHELDLDPFRITYCMPKKYWQDVYTLPISRQNGLYNILKASKFNDWDLNDIPWDTQRCYVSNFPFPTPIFDIVHDTMRLFRRMATELAESSSTCTTATSPAGPGRGKASSAPPPSDSAERTHANNPNFIHGIFLCVQLRYWFPFIELKYIFVPSNLT